MKKIISSVVIFFGLAHAQVQSDENAVKEFYEKQDITSFKPALIPGETQRFPL